MSTRAGRPTVLDVSSRRPAGQARPRGRSLRRVAVGGVLLALVFLGWLSFLGVPPVVDEAQAAGVKRVQSGTTTVDSNGGTNTVTVAITSVDATKAFLLFESTHAGNRPVNAMVRGRIASSTSLEFVRVSDEAAPGATINVRWYVVEYASGVSVQRGSLTQSPMPANVAITPVAAVDQAFVTWSKTVGSTFNNFDNNEPIVGELTTASNLQFRGVADAGATIWWQVIEFTDGADVNVQKGSVTTMIGTTTSVDATLPTAVDPSRTFVLASFLTSGGGADIGARMVSARLVDADTITFERSATGTPDDITEIHWQAVELADGSLVQHGSEDFAAGDGSETVTLARPIDTTRAVAFAGVQSVGGQNQGRTAYVGDDAPGAGSFRMSLTATQLTIARDHTTAAGDVGWFVVEWGPAGVHGVKKVQTGTTTVDSNGGTNTVTVTITAVDTTKAFLLFQATHSNGDPGNAMLRGRIASSTTLEFVRVSNDAAPGPTMNVRWYVVEYASGVSVQRGTATQSATTVDVAITPVASLRQAFVTWSKTPAAADALFSENDPVLAELTTTSNLQFRTDEAFSSHVIWWEVVEFTNPAYVNVQRGSITSMTGNTVSVTATLAESVDVTKTFVLTGYRSTGTGSDITSRLLRTQLTNGNTITIDRSANGANPGDDITEIVWQAVELRDGSTVQRGSEDFASADGSEAVAITSVDVNRAVAFAGSMGGSGLSMGRSPYAGDDVLGVASFRMSLAATQLTIARDNTADSADVGWFVVEFAPSVAFSASASTGAEGTTPANLAVTLSGASDDTVTVSYLVTGGTATGGGTDYTLASGTLTFVAGDTSEAIAVTVANDALDESDETVLVTLYNAANANLGAIVTHTFTITDDDAPPSVTLGLSGSPMAEAAGSATVTATLSTASGLDVTVDLAFAGTATHTSDYTRTGTSIVIAAGATTGTVTLTAVQDTLDEAAETVVVDVTGVTNGAESGTQQVTASITDDDAAPTVTLGLTGSPTAEAAGAATVTATLSAASGQDVTVNLAFAGTATLTSDYTRSGTSIVIAAGATTGTVTLTAVQDSLDEASETVIIDVSAVTNGAESGTQQVTASITDDDAAPTVTLSLSGSPAAEAAGSATVTATLSAASGQDVTVDLAFAGSATLTSDYTRSGTSIVIAAGATTGTVTLTAVQDTLDEAAETIVVDIAGVTNGAESGTQQVTASITDDDAAPTVTLSLTGSPTAEAAGAATVTATLSAASGQDVTVNLAFAGTATLTADYTRSGTSILIPAGATTGTVTLTAVQDTLDEAAETVIVDVSAVTNGAESGTQQVTVSITDDDAAPTVTLSLSGSPTAEAAGSATVTATLSTASGLDVTVDLAFAGTATLTSDYTRSGTSIVIAAGATTGTVTLTAVQDALDEASETIVVDILAVTNGAESGTQQVTASITDDDAAPTVTLSLSGSPTAEAAGSATVTATLNTASGLDVTVDFAFAGTATLTSDYTRSGTSIVIAAGATTGTVTLTAVQDTLDEAAETIVVDITGVTNGAESGTQQVTLSITDDDAGPTVTLGLSGSPLAEAAGAATVTATLSAASGQDVTVDLAFGGTATWTSDYTRSGTSIVIAAGATTGTVTLTAVQDTVDEAAETIVVDVVAVTNGAESGTQQVTASITDDDAAPTVTLSLTGSPLPEAAGAATVTATLSAASGQDVTVDLAFAGTATLASDYTRSGTSIVIAAGATTGTATLTAVQDAVDEADETIIVDVSAVTNGGESGAQQVTATVADDDGAPSVTLSLSGSPMAEAAGAATVTATLSAASSLDVTVGLTFAGTATVTSDYTRSATSIVIAAGATTGTATLTAVQDALDENAETVIVDVDAVTNGAESGAQQVTATIADDDAAPTVTLSLTGSPVAEAAGTATVTATLGAASGLDVTVDLAFAGTATVTDDYSRSGTSITIAAGATTGSVTLTAAQDSLDEAAETVVVDISAVTNGAESGTQQVTASIADDDAAPGVTLSLSGSPVAEAAGVATVTATLDAVSGQDVTVDLAFAGTATLTSDYTRSGTTIVLLAGATTGAVTLTAVQDALDENAETVVVDVAAVTNGAESGTQQVTATIADDDATPTVTLSLTGTPVAEAAGAATVTATLSAASGLDVTVDLGFAGTATLTSDYTRSATAITIPAGSTTGTVTLTAVQDALDETDESVVVDVTGATNALESGTQQVTATLADDDAPPSVTLALTGSPMAEAAGTATVTATLSGASGLDVTVNLLFGGSATVASDYTRSGASIVVAAGATTGTVTLSALQDTLDEAATETVIVDVDSVVNGVESGSQQVIAGIADDDAASGVTLSVSGTPMAEGGGVATVTATLANASGLDVTVTLGFSGSAAVTSDYTRSGTTILIPAGSTSGTATLTAAQDALDEPDEAVLVDIDAVANGAESGSQQVTAVIADDDAAPSVTLAVTGSPMAEAGSAATVTATLSAASGQTVTVNLAFSGTATLTSDYTRSGISVVLAPGATSGSVTLTAAPDALDEADETILVDVDSVANGVEATPQQATATVADDDAPPTVTLALAGSPVAEAAGVATVTATLGAASGLDVTVNLAFSGTAALTGDYTRSATSVLVAAGSTTGAVTLTAVQDTVDEVAETIIVDVDSVANGAESGTQQVTATVVDDDLPIVTVAATDAAAAEAGLDGGAWTISRASDDVAAPLAVPYTLGGTATSGADFAALTGTATIAGGSLAVVVSLTTLDDARVEADETVLLTLSANAAYTLGATTGGTVTLTSDDVAGITVSPVSGVSTTEAGGTANVTVVLTSRPSANVTIGLSTSNATEGTVAPTSLLFTAANWNVPQTVTVTGVDDLVLDGPVAYTVLTAAATSNDLDYAGRNPADVSLTNADDEVAGGGGGGGPGPCRAGDIGCPATFDHTAALALSWSDGVALTWTPAEASSVLGYLAWREDGSGWALVTSLGGWEATYRDAAGAETSRYRLTFYTGYDLAHGHPTDMSQPTSIPGWGDGEAQTLRSSSKGSETVDDTEEPIEAPADAPRPGGDSSDAPAAASPSPASPWPVLGSLPVWWPWAGAGGAVVALSVAGQAIIRTRPRVPRPLRARLHARPGPPGAGFEVVEVSEMLQSSAPPAPDAPAGPAGSRQLVWDDLSAEVNVRSTPRDVPHPDAKQPRR